MLTITFTERDVFFAEIVEGVQRGTMGNREAVDYLVALGYSRRHAHWWVEQMG